MLQKIFSSRTKAACNILKSINVVPEKTGSQTMLINFMSLTTKYNQDAPPVPNVLKAMKKPGFTVDYLLKCAVLTHFLIQYEAEHMDSLLEFVDYLKGKWEGLCQCFCNGQQSTSVISKKTMKTLSTQGDETIGKESLLLRQILGPYLGYIKKTGMIRREQTEFQSATSCQTWRLVNLLKTISGFTKNFTTIGRYYMKSYGGLVILLSEVLSFDITAYVTQNNNYLLTNYQLLSLSSPSVEDMREVDEFVNLLEEIGELNERFSQFYLGKYFYSYLKHIDRPVWMDNNSGEFDHIFKSRSRREKDKEKAREKAMQEEKEEAAEVLGNEL